MDLNICLKLPQFSALRLKEEEGAVYIEGALQNTDKACTECGKEQVKAHQYYRKTVRHLPILEHPTYLVFKQTNWCCQSCGNTFLEQVDFLENQRHCTKPYEAYLYKLAQKQDMQRVAEWEGLSWDTANRIFKKRSRKAQSRDRQNTGRRDLVH